MKKRILTILIAAALLAAMLTACGRKAEPEPTPTPEPTATPDPHEGMVEVTNGAGGTFWVDESETLTPFSLDRYSFSVTDNVVSYSRDDCTLLRGIDVSDYQNEIDWAAVAASGIDFAVVRVGWRGYSGGTVNEDNRWRENIQGAQAAGLKVGAYFFSQAINILEAAEEAVYTAKLLEGFTLELPVFFDWEIIGVDEARTDGVDKQTVTDCTLEFCRLMESAGFRAGVYSYIPVVYEKYDLDALEGLPVWMGDPGTWPEFYYEHDIWQYSVTGIVPGIEGYVDMDVMYDRSAASEPAMPTSPVKESATPAETAPAETEQAEETEPNG